MLPACLPACAAAFGCGKCHLHYSPIQSNENLMKVGNYCHVSLTHLLNSNPTLPSSPSSSSSEEEEETTSPTGAVVATPCSWRDPWGCGRCANHYVAQTEELLLDIARKCGVPLESLQRMNPVSRSSNLKVPCTVPNQLRYGSLLSTSPTPAQGRVSPIRSAELYSLGISLLLAPYSQSRHSSLSMSHISVGLPSLSSHSPLTALSLSPAGRFPPPALAASVPSKGPSPTSFPLPPNVPPVQTTLPLAHVATPMSSGFVGCSICGNSYEAGAGDTLYSVSAYCNVQLQQLISENPGVRDSNITGTTLRIPCTVNPANCTLCGSSHHIRQGDTLTQLADACGIHLLTIESANPDIDYDNLYVGQYITLPCGDEKALRSLEGCGACGITYNAVGNETVQAVAGLCGVSEQELRATNPALESRLRVSQGQVLNIPCNGNFSVDCGLCGINYTATETDNLTGVALKCRVGLIDLQLLNPGFGVDSAISGHMLRIPCQSTESKEHPICSSCSPSVQVLPNETYLTEIAHRCNVSTDLLSYANSIPQSGRVTEGHNLFVPCAKVGGPEQNCSICGSSITLHALVDFEKVVESCHVDESEIRDINPQVDLAQLAPGDKLNLPCNSSDSNCGPCGVAYRVTTNDTVQAVAVKCATAATRIRSLNPTSNFQGLLEGSVLKMPCVPPGTSSAGVIFKPFQLGGLEGPASLLACLLYLPLKICLGYFLILSFLVSGRTLENCM